MVKTIADCANVCICGACETDWTARGWECPEKFAFQHIRFLTHGIPRRAEQEFDNDVVTLEIVNAVTGIELYRRDIRSPLLCYFLICWFLENKTSYDPRCVGGHWTYWSYVLPNGRRGRLHLLSMLLDLMADEYPRDRLTVQLLRNSCEECEICGSSRHDEILPFTHCRLCGARPSRHHGRCCPASRPGKHYQDLCATPTFFGMLYNVLDHARLEEILREYSEYQIMTLCFPTHLELI